MEIFGFNHDDLESGGKASISFGTKNLMANERQMNGSSTNAGSFVSMDLFEYLNTTLYNAIPAELKNSIKAVNKKTSSGNNSSVIRTDTMKIWTPSVNEVAGTQSGGLVSNNEGTIYPVFTSDSKRIKRLSNGLGSADYWWLRSPTLGGTTSFCRVDSTGSVNSYNFASRKHGVCFGFCV